MKLEGHPQLDRLAAEYVLGTMPARARRRLETAMRSSSGVRAAVDRWSERLHRLSEVEFDRDPSPQVFAGIERRIDQGTRPRTEATRRSTTNSHPRSRFDWWSWLSPAGAFALGAVLMSGLTMLQRPEFETLTTPPSAPAARSIELRVLFAPDATIEQSNAALRAIGASIVAGPTAMGVLTVTVPQGEDVERLLDRLRAQPSVRFAEPVREERDRR